MNGNYLMEKQSNSTSSLDFPMSDLSQLIPIILLNATTIFGNLYFFQRVWVCFRRRSVLSITLLSALFFMLMTQIMLICFYLPVSWDTKIKIWYYRLLFGFFSSFFSCASVLHRFYSLIPTISQFTPIKNQEIYKGILYLVTGLLFVLWIATFYLTASDDEKLSSFRLSFGVIYWTVSLMTELIIGTILLYLVLKTKRPFMDELSIGKYLLVNYRPIGVHILCYATVSLTGVLTSSVDFSLGMYSFSFLRLLSAVSEGWCYISQVWFLVLIRDTTENNDYASKMSQLSGYISNTKVSKTMK